MSEDDAWRDDAIEAPVEVFKGHEILGYCFKGRYGYFPHVGLRRESRDPQAEWHFHACNHPRGGFRHAQAALDESLSAGKLIIEHGHYPDGYAYAEGGPYNLPGFRKLALTIEDADHTLEEPAYYWAIHEVLQSADGREERVGDKIAESRYPYYREYGEAVVAGAAALKRLIDEDMAGQRVYPGEEKSRG